VKVVNQVIGGVGLGLVVAFLLSFAANQALLRNNTDNA